MKKLIVCIFASLIVAFPFKVVTADEGGANNRQSGVESHIAGIYRQIDFSKVGRLSYEAFDKAYRGYLNLKSAGKLCNDKEIITVCDFKLPSTEKRMWIIDLAKRKVLFNTYVAHGQGSGEDYAMSFSNKENTHKSSLGFYVTGETYNGEHGTSLRLQGMDDGFNDAAFDRGIVVHGADYVSDKFINSQDRLGRSWGCPAVPSKLSLPIINTIKNGTCLFIYYPERNYLRNAYWLNKSIADVPQGIPASGLVADATTKARTIQYMTGGRIDSVKTVSIQ